MFVSLSLPLYVYVCAKQTFIARIMLMEQACSGVHCVSFRFSYSFVLFVMFLLVYLSASSKFMWHLHRIFSHIHVNNVRFDDVDCYVVLYTVHISLYILSHPKFYQLINEAKKQQPFASLYRCIHKLTNWFLSKLVKQCDFIIAAKTNSCSLEWNWIHFILWSLPGMENVFVFGFGVFG